MNNKTITYRIGIDCRLSGNMHAGIGRYVENLINHLLEIDHKNQYVLFFSDKFQAEQVIAKSLPDNVELRFIPIKHYSLAEQLKLPFIFDRANLDLLHVPHFNAPIFYRKKTILTIHDLLWHEQRGVSVTTLPPFIYWIKYIFYRFLTSININNAKAILVPAKTIKQTVINFYPKVKTKTQVTNEGLSTLFKNQHQKTHFKESNQLIYTGSLYPHKNIQVVLKSMPMIPNVTLKIVGSRNAFVDRVKKQVKKLGLENRVEFAGFLSDSELAAEYQKSLALVQPSKSEGFGLTGLEAMGAGLPVLASDIPIFREIYQTAAQFFDPNSTESFIQAFTDLKKHSQDLVKNGRQQIKLYSWKKMCQQTLDVYYQVLTQL